MLQNALRHATAAFVVFHVLAVAVMSIPPPPLAGRGELDLPTKQSVAAWAEAAGSLGLPAAAIRETLEEALPLWARTLRRLQSPFRPYARITGALQSWRMFGTVRTRVARLEIDLHQDGVWVPLYRPQSSEHDWSARLLRQERMRAEIHRFEKHQHRLGLKGLADVLARRARGAVPGDRIRIGMRELTIPPPAALRREGHLREGAAYWVEERAL